MTALLDRPSLRRKAGHVDSPRTPRHIFGIPLAELLWLSLPVAFTLWALRGDLVHVPYLSDSAMHQQMVRWADAMIRMGHVPLDGWYPYLQLGSAHFHHYQSLPHILTAYAGQLIGWENAFHLAVYLLVAIFPISIYVTARLFDLPRRAAIAAAILAPLVSSRVMLGFDWGSYVWRSPGVWSQMWGMVLLGPAMGLSWRAVRGRGSIFKAVLLVGATLALHFLMGYHALAALAIFVIAQPSELFKRLRRALVIGACSIASVAFAVYPLIRDARWIARSVDAPSLEWDSYGARKVLGWLFGGEVFDARRWPVISLLVAIGLVVCVRRFRTDEASRVFIGLFGFFLLLVFGRPTLGPLLKVLPFSDSLFLQRFFCGVHLAGLMLAGTAWDWLVSRVVELRKRMGRLPRNLVTGAALIVVTFGLLAAGSERVIMSMQNAEWVGVQARNEATEGKDVDALIEKAKSLGGGRIYAGSKLNWADGYRVGFVPTRSRIVYRDGDVVGELVRTGALSNPIESRFDEKNPAHYDLFNVRYLLLPEYRQPKVPATLIEERNGNYLYEVETSGYLEAVETIAPIEADNVTLQAANLEFLSSDLVGRGLHPTVDFAGTGAAEPTASASDPDGHSGTVLDQSDSGVTGTYSGRVSMQRPGVVMLKSSFDPGWVATVDGVERPAFMVAPSFVGVEVASGEHDVRFTYRSTTNYPLLFLIGGLVLAALYLWERRRAR